MYQKSKFDRLRLPSPLPTPRCTRTPSSRTGAHHRAGHNTAPHHRWSVVPPRPPLVCPWRGRATRRHQTPPHTAALCLQSWLLWICLRCACVDETWVSGPPSDFESPLGSRAGPDTHPNWVSGVGRVCLSGFGGGSVDAPPALNPPRCHP